PEPKPFDLTRLSPAQRQLWQTLQAEAENQGTERAAVAARIEELKAAVANVGRVLAIESARKFLDSNPPENFAGAAKYTLGMLLKTDKKKEDAAKCFQEVVTKHPQATGESGLPLAPLAEFRWLELAGFGGDRPVNVS